MAWAEKPMSPAASRMTRYGRPSSFRQSSAWLVMIASSAWDWLARQILTISTLLNWCWRRMPRVSLP